MAIGETLREDCNAEEEETASVDSECLDDSDDDPSFDIIEETRSALSKISLKKPRIGRDENIDVGTEREPEMVPKMDEEEGKSFEKVQQLVKGGDLEKLKLDQCKIYLRKHGLRLTGNKSVLISRIREHQEIIDGCGLKKYPPESFVLNCKGDACVGDVVIFEQNVYELFSVASRSATGPPCGTRTIAGRIVKESYGVAKQQHTFTIEVLWSEGVKPLPPLYQLLIKGRNLYRFKTMRQRWVDEGERQKVLQEKHARGSRARHSREIRIQEKENRKGMMMRRHAANGHLTQINKEYKQPLKPGNAVQQTKCLNHDKLLQGQDVKTNSSTQQMGGRENFKQQQQPPPLQAILEKPNTAEHCISPALPWNSCENYYPSQTQDSWNSNYVNPRNAFQQKKCLNHEKLMQGQDVKSNSSTQQIGGWENLKQQQQPPLQAILEKPNTAEHCISPAQPRNSCENYYPSRTHDSWKSNYVNPRGSYANFHGLQQPSILGRPMHYFHPMPIRLQQQYQGYRGETSPNYFHHQGR